MKYCRNQCIAIRIKCYFVIFWMFVMNLSYYRPDYLRPFAFSHSEDIERIVFPDILGTNQKSNVSPFLIKVRSK